jgi:signal transduction histidine kinase
MRHDEPEQCLRVLILEDVPTDAELVEHELRSAGIELLSERVDNQDSFREALDLFSPEIIISDYSLPGFDGESALRMAQEKAPSVPFIFVTGALGEERAVDLMKSGATDFVLKDHLPRLPLCVRRALEEVEEKQRRRRAEEDLRQAYAEQKIYTKMLEQSNRELQDFVYVASHDLQEPIRKIQTFAGRLRTGCNHLLDEKGRDCLERMLGSARRMQALIRDCLKYSEIASEPESFTAIDLGCIVEETVADLEVLIEETGAFIELGALPIIEANAVQMRRLFQNLIGNSIKYRKKDKPVVKVYSDKSGFSGFHEIRVEDNGIGFDQCYLDKIFKPFQRLHGRNSPYAGTGMGLAICRRIVERHGGSITANSEPGKGAVFVVSLPERQSKLGNMP